jgi:glycosyltransferase involved in cell wall biosynthesis
MHILSIAPVFLPLSPRLKYAGTERVIAGLNEHYSQHRGVKSIVAATGDSDLGGKGRLIYTYPQALWSLGAHIRKVTNPEALFERQFIFCMEFMEKRPADIIHDHAGFAASNTYSESDLRIPVVSTIHGDVYKPEMYKYVQWKRMQDAGRNVHFVAISRSQKRKFEQKIGLRFAGVVHNGVPVESYPFVDSSGKHDYLFWLGRICNEKGTDLAIKLAKVTGRPLIIAGEVHTINKHFYERKVRPHITRFLEGRSFKQQERSRQEFIAKLERGEQVVKYGEIIFIGPVDDRQKQALYSRAYCQIVLNRWEEPFGLIMPEAMATGTPVLGTRLGSIPEIVKHKATGFVLPATKDRRGRLKEDLLIGRAVKALEKVPQIKPRDCRARVEKFFSNSAMAKGYLKLFRSIIKNAGAKGAEWTASGGTTMASTSTAQDSPITTGTSPATASSQASSWRTTRSSTTSSFSPPKSKAQKRTRSLAKSRERSSTSTRR